MSVELRKRDQSEIDEEDVQHNHKKRRTLEILDPGYGLTPEMSEIDNVNDSPDMFEDCSPMEEETEQTSDSTEVPEKQEKIEKENTWRGATLDEIRNGSSPVLPPVSPSHNHTVFFQVPIVCNGEPPKPYPQSMRDCWDSNHVRMPCSEHSLYPVQKCGEQRSLRQRWEMVQEALLKSIVSSQQLETAILAYNSKYSGIWDFNHLHSLLEEEFSEEESDNFFTSLLPQIVRLALQLPELLTAPIPLLVQHRNHSLSFTQLQIASLLANAFLCTFPRRNSPTRQSEYGRYPDINFTRLYEGNGRYSRKSEKLKCLLHYFRRVCTKAPDGVVTFTRRYLNQSSLPRWDRSQKLLTKLHITSKGTIEDDGGDMLQVDFANKFVGGGVLRGGCVQEEIRFVICPELLVAKLFTEALDATEALLIVGCERFSSYKGYADSFQWTGDYIDNTPRDSSNRRLCAVVAIDALRLTNCNVQFTPSNLMRELNKAYAGFYCPESSAGDRLVGVASGNWGCGAFRGDAKLKSLIQLMAASQAGRSLAYFTFGDEKLREEVYHLYTYLKEQEVTVGQLWRMLCQYYESSFRGSRFTTKLYPFLYQTLSKKMNSASTSFFQPLSRKLVAVDRPRGEGEQSEYFSSKSRSALNQKELEEALTNLSDAKTSQSSRKSENYNKMDTSSAEGEWLSKNKGILNQKRSEETSVTDSSNCVRKNENRCRNVTDESEQSTSKNRRLLNQMELEEALASLPVKECDTKPRSNESLPSKTLASNTEKTTDEKHVTVGSDKKRISLFEYLERYDKNSARGGKLELKQTAALSEKKKDTSVTYTEEYEKNSSSSTCEDRFEAKQESSKYDRNNCGSTSVDKSELIQDSVEGEKKQGTLIGSLEYYINKYGKCRNLTSDDKEGNEASVGSEKKHLEQIDRNNSLSSPVANASPTPKRKISDYFASSSRSKK